MPLYIKDQTTTELVNELARSLGTTKQAAVKQAVQVALGNISKPLTMREKLEQFWAAHPMPPPTGEVADKAFFDELSGNL